MTLRSAAGSSPRRLVVVSGGLSVPSSTRLLADRLAASTQDALGGLGLPVTVEVVELRVLAHDITNAMLNGFASPALQAAIDAVTSADGLVAVTPVFNASYAGLFKSFFDVIGEGALEGVATLLAATGGTARHSLVVDNAMRPLFAYLRATPVATGVFAATDDWGTGQRDGSLARRIGRAGRELATLVSGAPAAARTDPFADPVPFEQLLGAGG